MSEIKKKFNPLRLEFVVLLPAVAIVVYVAYLAQAIYVERALYADGANFFVELLSKKRFWPIADDSWHIRLFVNVVNQFPVVLALELGVTSLRTLKILFGVGLFLGSVVVYFYCFCLSRRANDYRVFFFSIASLVTCAIPSSIFILNQAFTSLALAWVLVHYLLLDLKIKSIDWFVFLFISLILFRSHESLIVWGGVFFAGSLCAIFYRDGGHLDNSNLLKCTIGGIGLLQSSFVAFWQYTHPAGEKNSAFLKLTSLLKPSELWIGNTRISLLMLIAMFLVFVTQYRYGRTFGRWNVFKNVAYVGLISVVGLMLLSGVSALNDFSLTNPGREFSYRFLITFGSAGWMLLAIIFVIFNKPLNHTAKPLSMAVLSMGIISASLWQISNNIQWSIFCNATTEVLRNSSSLIIDPIEVNKKLISVGHENTFKYRWGWAWPVFGMSLQDSGEVEKLFRPDGYGEYFNPPKHIPFIMMSGGEIGSEGLGLFRFDSFSKLQDSK